MYIFLLAPFNSINKYLFFKCINKCQTEILSCAPPSYVCDFIFKWMSVYLNAADPGWVVKEIFNFRCHKTAILTFLKHYGKSFKSQLFSTSACFWPDILLHKAEISGIQTLFQPLEYGQKYLPPPPFLTFFVFLKGIYRW